MMEGTPESGRCHSVCTVACGYDIKLNKKVLGMLSMIYMN
jgi:hypothetical protein